MNLQKAFDSGFEAVKQYVDRSFEQFEKQLAEANAASGKTTLHLTQMICDLENKLIDLEKRGFMKGEPGPPGKDADNEAIAQRLIPEIERKLEEIAPKDGKDGKDGAGVVDQLIDAEGNLISVYDDGQTKIVGKVRGEDGKPGKDGRGFDNIELLEDATHWGFRFGNGDESKDLWGKKPTIADFYFGVWKPGKYDRSSLVTHAGSTWIAKETTEQKPGDGDHWQMMNKRGRDGRDGKNGERGERGERGLPGRDGRDLTQLDTSGVKY